MVPCVAEEVREYMWDGKLVRYRQRSYPCELAARYGWAGDRTCCHLSCGLAAGMRLPVAGFNATFANELHAGWLRFDLDRAEVRAQRARLYWAAKRWWIEHGRGEVPFMAFVFAGIWPVDAAKERQVG